LVTSSHIKLEPAGKGGGSQRWGADRAPGRRQSFLKGESSFAPAPPKSAKGARSKALSARYAHNPSEKRLVGQVI
jgi:hypothetical protein